MRLIETLKKLWNKFFVSTDGKASVAVRAVSILKKAVESPMADVVAALIKGQTDDRILAALRIWLPKILREISLVTEENLAPETAIEKAAARLQSYDRENRSSYYKTLATRIYQEDSDADIPFDEALETTQIVYKTLKEKGEIE